MERALDTGIVTITVTTENFEEKPIPEIKVGDELAIFKNEATVSDAVVFFASDRVSYIHGVIYNVAGGKTRG